MRILYSCLIRFYGLAALIAAIFNQKARKWVKGRISLFHKLRLGINGDDIIWIHCSSVGEFEQGLPIAKSLKRQHPRYKILLTFFSPSGFEAVIDSESIDFIFYIPLDTRRNAKKFIEIVRPKLAIFVKNDFWFNHLSELNDKNIPTIYISVFLSRNHFLFKGYAIWFRKILSQITHLYVQNVGSKKLLSKIDIPQVSVVGDTRIDRVQEKLDIAKEYPAISKWINGRKIVVAGSVYGQDTKLLSQLIKKNKDVLFIIAPHFVNDKNINRIRKHLGTGALRYSRSKSRINDQEQVVLLDTLGDLYSLYRYATFVYIGGGFNSDQIHNIQEPASFGKPIIIGPNYDKFNEAIELVKLGGAFTIKDTESLEIAFTRLNHDKKLYIESSSICKEYINKNIGATKAIMTSIDYLL